MSLIPKKVLEGILRPQAHECLFQIHVTLWHKG